MKERICIYLERLEGEVKVKGNPVKRAKATCFADTEEDCPKTRAKFRITEVCFRIRKPQKKGKDVDQKNEGE